MATVGSLVVRIGADVSGLSQALQSAQGSLRNFGGSLKSMGTGLTLGVTAPLVGIAATALRSAADFEQSMNLIQATTGATGADMEALQQQALDLGASTSFSAGEAASAMLELSKAGMTMEQTSAAIPGVLDLAAASGMGLAESATITANAINTFGLEAGDAAAVANTFAAAANASSANVDDLAAGFQMAGAVFAANGQTVDDLATSLAILANNGIAGSDAGTSLKTMMMRLAAPTDEASAAIGDLGLKIYDAQGTMLPFGEIIGQLETATSGLSDEQRNAALQTIFGADAIRAATILANEGAAGYTAMSTAVGQQGAAATMANANMKGLGGAIEYFKGTIDSLMIGTAAPFMQMLSNWVRGAADLIAQFGTLSPETQKWAVIVGVVAAAAGPLLMVLGAMATGLAALLSPVGLVVAAVAALGVAWATNFGGIQEKTAAAWAVIQPLLAQAMTWFQETIPAALTALQTGFGTAWTTISTGVQTALQPLAETWTSVVTAFQTGQTSFSAIAGEIGASLLGINTDTYDTTDAIREFVIALTGSTAAADTVDAALATIRGALDALIAFMAPAIERLTGAFGSIAPQVAAMQPVIDGLVTSMTTAFTTLWTAIEPILAGIGAALAVVVNFGINLLAAAIENMAAIAAPIFDQLGLSVTGLSTIISEMVTLIGAIFSGDWATVWQSAQDIATAFKTVVVGSFENLVELVTALVTTIASAVTDTLTDMGVDVGAVLTTIQTTWSDIWGSLVEFVQPAIDKVQEVIDALQGVWDWLKEHVFTNPFEGWDFNPFNNGGDDAGKNAVGTPSWKGGATWVGEFGPELVSLPAGSRIFSHDDSMGMMGTGGPRVVIEQVIVRNDLDLEELRWKLEQLTRRRG